MQYVLDDPETLHMLLLHVCALVLGGVPLLQQENFVLVLAGEIVVIPQAALLRSDGRKDAALHDAPQELLPAAGLAK